MHQHQGANLQSYSKEIADLVASDPSKFVSFIISLKDYFKHHYQVEFKSQVNNEDFYGYRLIKTCFEEFIEGMEDYFLYHIMSVVLPTGVKSVEAQEKNREGYLRLTNRLEDVTRVLKSVSEQDVLFTHDYDDNHVKRTYNEFVGFKQHIDLTLEFFYRAILKKRDRDYVEAQNLWFRDASKKFLAHLASIKKIVSEEA